MSDIGITIAVEDSAVRAGMGRAEATINSSLQKITTNARGRLGGIFGVQELIGRTASLIGGAAGGFGIVAAYSAVSSLMESMKDSAAQALQAARAEAKERSRIAEDVQRTGGVLRELASPSNPVWRSLGEVSAAARAKRTALWEQFPENKVDPETKKETPLPFEERMRNFTRREAEMKWVAKEEEEAIARIRRENGELAQRLALEAEIAAARAESSGYESDARAEVLRHDFAERDLRRKLSQSMSEERDAILETIGAEQRRHDATMRGLVAKEQASVEATMRAEDEALARDRAQAEEMKSVQEIGLAKAKGDEARARRLQAELDGTRKIRQIEALGIDDAEKRMLIDRERELMTVARLEQAGGKGGGQSFAAAAAGIINRGAATLQLGGVSQIQGRTVSAAEKTEKHAKRAADGIQAMRADLKALAGRPATVA